VHIISFIDHIIFEKRYSQHTALGYRNDLEQFFIFTQQTFDESNPSAITFQMVRSWIVQLMKEGYQPKSVRRKISSLQSYYKYLRKHQIVNHNPTKGLVLPKIGKNVPSFISQKDIPSLYGKEVSIDESNSNYKNLLEETIVACLYNFGLRRSELLNLKIQDINTISRSISVIGKGNKQRLIPMNTEIHAMLSTFVAARLNLVTDSNLLFINEQGRALYPNYIYRLVKQKLNSIGNIEKPRPHLLRHSFASHLSQEGAELGAIKELLGHSSLSSTQIYTHHSIDGLKKMYQKTHPKAKDNNSIT
jgi:integrase/recombinase XerC